jgi:DHA2 family multidrug resistance protein
MATNATAKIDDNSMIEYGFRRAIITLTVVICTLLEIIDTTIVNVASNHLMGNLGATISEVSWVVAAYAIANIIVVPMSGWLSAQIGRKKYFAGSVALFTLPPLCAVNLELFGH